MDAFSTSMENFTYFTVSLYITYAILAIVIPTAIIRLLRTFPYYVSHGDMGNDDNCLWLGDSKRDMRTQILDMFTETHPGAIGADLLSVAAIIVILFIAWGAVPFIVGGRLIWLGVRKLANNMRDQYLKKEEFHAALKGD